ncbi:hypothetical protein [Streptomyces sp. PU_AKi4]|uniref:hypothetical protein n=1 Tax=Streptomyces sp. PU_AKi4 TaxID=2800809 RepID=UPI0035269DE7
MGSPPRSGAQDLEPDTEPGLLVAEPLVRTEIKIGYARVSTGGQKPERRLDTTTPGGRFVLHVFAALAEFIRELVVLGTNEGPAAARVGGRPTVATEEVVRAARGLLPGPGHSVTSIAKPLGVSPGAGTRGSDAVLCRDRPPSSCRPAARHPGSWASPPRGDAPRPDPDAGHGPGRSRPRGWRRGWRHRGTGQ